MVKKFMTVILVFMLAFSTIDVKAAGYDYERSNKNVADIQTKVLKTESKVATEVKTESSADNAYLMSAGKSVWVKKKGAYIYLNKKGKRVAKKAGWYKINGKYYYLKKNGKRVSKKAGWYKIGSKYYYLKKSGVRVTKKAGWYKINGEYCYLKKNGTKVAKKAGWYKIGNKYYYIEASCSHPKSARVAKYKTVHHDAEYKTEKVWVEKWVNVTICNTCGKEIKGTVTEHDEASGTTEINIGTDDEPVMIDAWNCNGSHSDTIDKGYYEKKKVKVKDAYDEKVVDYYYCGNCGKRL